MNEKLTSEQAEVVQFARSGHNLLITGQAGVGKSKLVNAIHKDCKQRGLEVAVVCSSGIACQVYENGIAATVHSFYGLGAADLPSKQVLLRAASNNKVSSKLRNMDVLIWDEASMSSARMTELVNALHHHLSVEECHERLPFAEKQIIIVCEFLQLRPVPSCFDSGLFMLKSKVFQHAITHRFQLTKVMRQSETDKLFVAAQKDVRLGMCSSESGTFISQLARDPAPQLANDATHIFSKGMQFFSSIGQHSKNYLEKCLALMRLLREIVRK